MLNRLARLACLAVLGAFAVAAGACSNGVGTSLPFAGLPSRLWPRYLRHCPRIKRELALGL